MPPSLPQACGFTLVFGLTACSGTRDEAPLPDLAPRSQLAVAADLDPDPEHVHVKLVAKSTSLVLVGDRPTQLKTFSDTVPGPVIRARRGEQLVVDLENQLDEPTTLHFHGVRVPNAMDGVPDETQPAVAPGATFRYEFELPDAGLYWYHPHFDSVTQLGSGLYGAILVDDPDEPADIGDPLLLVLSDVSLDRAGGLEPDSADANTIAMGREGNVALVNGKVQPTFAIASGRRQRLHVLNAARSRYFRLGIAGQTFTLLGSDGGRAESPTSVETPLITPGERLDLLLAAQDRPGAVLELVAEPFARGRALVPSARLPLASLSVVESSLPPSGPLPELQRVIEPVASAGAEQIKIALTMTSDGVATTMGINDQPYGSAEPIHTRVLGTQILMVENKSPYNHPFHLHGFFFQQLGPDLTPLHPIQNKDTIDVPPFSGMNLAVHYDDRPGMWMFHCHILDHAEAGMMGMIHVMR